MLSRWCYFHDFFSYFVFCWLIRYFRLIDAALIYARVIFRYAAMPDYVFFSLMMLPLIHCHAIDVKEDIRCHYVSISFRHADIDDTSCPAWYVSFSFAIRYADYFSFRLFRRFIFRCHTLWYFDIFRRSFSPDIFLMLIFFISYDAAFSALLDVICCCHYHFALIRWLLPDAAYFRRWCASCHYADFAGCCRHIYFDYVYADYYFSLLITWYYDFSFRDYWYFSFAMLITIDWCRFAARLFRCCFVWWEFHFLLFAFWLIRLFAFIIFVSLFSDDAYAIFIILLLMHWWWLLLFHFDADMLFHCHDYFRFFCCFAVWCWYFLFADFHYYYYAAWLFFDIFIDAAITRHYFHFDYAIWCPFHFWFFMTLFHLITLLLLRHFADDISIFSFFMLHTIIWCFWLFHLFSTSPLFFSILLFSPYLLFDFFYAIIMLLRLFSSMPRYYFRWLCVDYGWCWWYATLICRCCFLRFRCRLIILLTRWRRLIISIVVSSLILILLHAITLRRCRERHTPPLLIRLDDDIFRWYTPPDARALMLPAAMPFWLRCLLIISAIDVSCHWYVYFDMFHCLTIF